jgi:hypothetical protein
MRKLLEDPDRATATFEVLEALRASRSYLHIQIIWGLCALWLGSYAPGAFRWIALGTAWTLIASSIGFFFFHNAIPRFISGACLAAFGLGTIGLVTYSGFKGFAWIGPIILALLLLAFASLNFWIGIQITRRFGTLCTSSDLTEAKSLVSAIGSDGGHEGMVIDYSVLALGRLFPAKALLLPHHALIIIRKGRSMNLLPRSGFRIQAIGANHHQVIYPRKKLPIQIGVEDFMRYQLWESTGS